MLSELQAIVDSVASRVGRPALIEDHRQRVVVYSEQLEPMDEVRRLSILRRQTTPEVIAFFREVGIMQAREPIRTPACDELQMLPRVCVPIRHGDLLLGFVWLIDAGQSMTGDEIVSVSRTTTDLALALYRENLAGELASQRETEAIRLLLADERDARRHGAMTLLENGLLSGDDVPTTAVVARLILRPNVRLDDLARIALEQALVASRRWTGSREAVHLVRYDHGVLLVHDRRGAATSHAATSHAATSHAATSHAVAEHLNDALQTTIRGLSSVAGAVVGVGRPRSELSEVRMSYDEAVLAARVAVQVPAVGPVANWSQLGIYRVLSQLSSEVLSNAGVHPGLEKLIEDPASRPLLETLETYLDLAGNAHATAVQMNVHRTSVYYRLQRVEQLVGTDLRNGNERLSLHLALKLSQLAGQM